MKCKSVILLLLLSFGLNGQSDSLVIPRHRHLKANVSHTGFNLVLNRVNRHVLPSGKDWANVSWESWKENLGKLPSWDWDLFTTNWFAHPYQGAMYYNAARTLKFNYFTSMSYAITGTAMWEYFGEDLPPSSNDFVTNILGGIYLGEVMFRLSENILDDRAKGGQRRKKEILGALVNPMGGMNRLFYCQSGKHYDFKNHIQGKLGSEFFIGGSAMLSTSRNSTQSVIPQLGYRVKYGEILKGFHNYSPFDVFWLETWLRFDQYNDGEGFQIAKPVFNFSSTALIHGRNLTSGWGGIRLYGLFQDYEYLNTYTYKFGSLSFSLGMIQEINLGSSEFQLRSEFGIVVLAAVESTSIDWVRPDDQGDERDYVMGHGMVFKLYSDWSIPNVIDITGHYGLWYVPVASGPEGDELIQQMGLQISKSVSRRIKPGLKINYFKRRGDYIQNTDKIVMEDHNFEMMVSVSYTW